MITKKGQGGTNPPFLEAGLESVRRLIFEQGNVMSRHIPASAQRGNNMGLGKGESEGRKNNLYNAGKPADHFP